MPMYDYKCPACGHECEVIHSIASDKEIGCPKCLTKMEREYKVDKMQIKVK